MFQPFALELDGLRFGFAIVRFGEREKGNTERGRIIYRRMEI